MKNTELIRYYFRYINIYVLTDFKLQELHTSQAKMITQQILH